MNASPGLVGVTCALALGGCLAAGGAVFAAGNDVPFPVAIQVDAAHPRGPWRPIWRFFGADEPNYAYMRHGSELLGELGNWPRTRSFSARIIF